jgi:hypothetical protein
MVSEAPAPPTLRRSLEAPRAAGIAGLVFAALFITAVLLLRGHPPSGSTPEEVESWYLRGHGRRIAVVGLYIVPFAGIAFLWFLAVIRHNVSAFQDRFFDTVLLGSGLLFVGMLWSSAAAAGSTVAAVEFLDARPPSPDVVEGARSLGYTLFYIYALRAAAVFVMITSTLAWRSGAAPRWLSVAGFVTAVVMLLSVSFVPLVSLLFPAWVAALSIAVLTRTRAAQPVG